MMLLREWIVKGASSYVFMLGFIWVLIDDKNRGWHDKILDTYVIDQKESARLNGSVKTSTRDASNTQAKEDESVENAAISIESVIEPIRTTAEETVANSEKESEAIEAIEAKDSAKAKDAIETIGAVKAKDAEDAAPRKRRAGMSMKKDELLEIADEMGLKADPGMTKAQIIELLENAAAKDNKE